jgi:transposase
MAHFSLSDLKRFLAVDPDHPYWMGIDVHKNSYHIALRRSDGNDFTWSAPASPERLLETITDLQIPIEGVCYESGPTGFTLARTLGKAGIPVIVGAASKVPRSISVGSKTDRLDCIKLAEFVSKGLIKPIAIPTEEEEYQRSLLRRRTQVVDGIRRCKQRIKSLFLYHGYEEPKEIALWQKDSLQALRSTPLPKDMKLTLNSYVRELKYLQDELATVAKHLKSIAHNSSHHEVMKALTSVPGVGEVVATTFLLEIFDPGRFTRGEEVASYIGLAPRVHHSGEKTPKGHIVATGQTRLRSLLVEAAWMWRAKDEYARETYNKLVSRLGIPQKAITALARKLSIILWRLSIEQRAYRPM